jgi:hypothetical protein
MKEIFYNNDHLKDKDINNFIDRAKMLIINSHNEILLNYSHNTYHLPGGHLEKEETFDECVSREILEETGIEIPIQKRDPFLIIKYYCQDYPKEGLNTNYKINYYIIKTDLTPDIKKIKMTDNEKEGNLIHKYLSLDIVLIELEKSMAISQNKNTTLDTIQAIKEYKESLER